MLEVMRINRLISLRKQLLKSKSDAKKSLNKGDLNDYYEKLKKANKLKSEFSETLHMKV